MQSVGLSGVRALTSCDAMRIRAHMPWQNSRFWRNSGEILVKFWWASGEILEERAKQQEAHNKNTTQPSHIRPRTASINNKNNATLRRARIIIIIIIIITIIVITIIIIIIISTTTIIVIIIIIIIMYVFIYLFL